MKKSILIITTTILCLFGSYSQEVNSAIKEAMAQEQTEVTTVDAIPSEYMAFNPDGGKIEYVEYKTKDYFGDGSEITKRCNVYLPSGYSTEKKYPVLYLMHGIGGTESEWGMWNDSSIVKRIMDNLIKNGEIEPFIIVCPNGRSGKDFANTNSNYGSFYKFGSELRNDLIPFLESKYSVRKDRDGRAMAGLSMGGMQTINIGLCECVDLISYFGAFSAAPTSYPVTKVAAILEAKKDYPVNYFYNICGLEDNVAYGAHMGAAKLLPRMDSDFIEGKNFTWQEIHGGHTFSVWYLGFYNFARIAFTK